MEIRLRGEGTIWRGPCRGANNFMDKRDGGGSQQPREVGTMKLLTELLGAKFFHFIFDTLVSPNLSHE